MLGRIISTGGDYYWGMVDKAAPKDRSFTQLVDHRCKLLGQHLESESCQFLPPIGIISQVKDFGSKIVKKITLDVSPLIWP